ncbi:MAG: response regulator transcription factor [Cyclobacteriaceae bacterium]
MSVLIIEDDPITRQDLKEVLSTHGFTIAGTAINHTQGLQKYLSTQPDVLLVDVKLGEDKDGVDLVNTIKTNYQSEIPVVFLTANSDEETKRRAFFTQPASFLTKPFSKRNLMMALELAFEKSIVNKDSGESNQYLFLKEKDSYAKVRLADILYLKADGSYCSLVTFDRAYLLSSNLSHSMQKFNLEKFVRIHRSFVVNIDHVTSMDTNNVHLGNYSFPIGRHYKKEVIKKIQRID